MLKKGIGFFFFTTQHAVEGGAIVLVFLRNGALFVWRRNVVRKWAFISFEYSVDGLGRYINRVAGAVRCRRQYRICTLPMKAQYRSLTRNKKTI